MGVKIEILDYQYSTGDNIIDLNEAATATEWTVNNPFSGSFAGTGGTGTVYLTPVTTEELKIGQEYRLKFRVQNHNGAGEIGFSTQDASGVTIGIGSSARLIGNGNIDITFTCTATGFPRIFAQNTITAAKIDRLEIYQMSVIDWDNSVVGELDVTDHDDFPLALTFQISDIKDITSTSGDYSKTFKVPATKNNNNLLKHIYIPNINVDNKVNSPKKCRILLNNIFALSGTLRVTGVTGIDQNPIHYNCIFLGNNIGWSEGIGDSTMLDLFSEDGYGDGNVYKRENIISSWDQIDSSTNNDLIVYPIVSYGDYNPDGREGTIQLLDNAGGHYDGAPSGSRSGYYGFDSSGDSYATPTPSSDWRPALWVRKTILRIFNQQGYQVVSNFFDSSIFKGLIWTLPNLKYSNPEERQYKYGVKTTIALLATVPINTLTRAFTSSGSGFTHKVMGTGFTLGTLGTNFTYSNDYINTDITYSNNAGSLIEGLHQPPQTAAIYAQGGGSYFEIAEYGFYTIKTSALILNISGLVVDKGDGAGFVELDKFFNNTFGYGVEEFLIYDLYVMIEVKTVGETAWVPRAYKQLFQPSPYYYGSDNSTNTQLGPNIGPTGGHSFPATAIEKSTYLNKGDQVRLTTFIRCKPDSLQADGNYKFNTKLTVFGMDIQINPTTLHYGQTFDIKDLVDSEHKQIDFIKGVSHAFNLQMTTNESSKIVTIEPFSDFYKPYAFALDWTGKVDRDQKSSDKWLTSKMKRNLVFKYKEDSSDAKVKRRSEIYFDNLGDEYPYQEILSNEFDRGTTTHENPFFSGTYNTNDHDGGGEPSFGVQNNKIFKSACLWAENASSSSLTRPEQGNDFRPRLLFYNKFSPTVNGNFPYSTSNPPAGLTTSKSAQLQVWSVTLEHMRAWANGAASYNTGINFIPQATSYNREDINSPCLSYGNITASNYNPDYIAQSTTPFAPQVAVKGLFDTYYKQSFEMLKSSPRVRSVYITFTISEIINLDFRKLVYIDGCYWRINRISDYKPLINKSTKVELIEWLQLGTFAIKAPSIGDDSTWTDSGDGGAEDDSNNNIGL